MLKKLLLVVLVVLIGATLLVVGRVLPGHLQLRGMEVALPDLEQLDAFLAAGDSATYPDSVSYLNTASQSGGALTLVHTAVLIGWPDGRAFLIDAGMNRTQAVEFGRLIELLLGADPTRPHGPVEEQLGVAVDGVAGIAFTHLHADHTGGITGICAAQLEPATIFQTEPQASLHNSDTQAGQELIDSAACGRQLLGDEPIKGVPGFPGIAVIAAGGHTPGSTLFAVRTRAGNTWLFSGDLTNTLADLRANRGKGFFYSYLLVPEDTELLERWRRWLGQALAAGIPVVVAHDRSSFEAAGIELREP